MNGADALVATLGANGIEVVFANAGTSEMHVVAALDGAPGLRPVLCLFEGVATGAADGYARVSGGVAATLLHLGPGLANGWANLHNARRAGVPVLNVVGVHPDAHDRLDPPLSSRVGQLAASLGGAVTTVHRTADVPAAAAQALASARHPRAQVSTLLVPADVAWSPFGDAPSRWPTVVAPEPVAPAPDDVARALGWLRAGRAALVVGGALTSTDLSRAAAVAQATGARLLLETFPTIVDHGAGTPSPERIVYLSDFAIPQLSGLDRVVLVGAAEPVGFFAYPDLPSRLLGAGCQVLDLGGRGAHPATALALLAAAAEADGGPGDAAPPPAVPSGPLTPATFAAAVAATVPEGAIVVDEANTGGVHLYDALAGAAPHRLLTLTGGAIGFGLPAALGAALASDAPVIALVADGALEYTTQALWSLAREDLDVTVVVVANAAYDILRLERARLGPLPTSGASHLLTDLGSPVIDHVSLARAYGVPAQRVESADELVTALARRAPGHSGPQLIEVPLAPLAL